MYPNQSPFGPTPPQQNPTTPPPLPGDYLNQIAPQAPKKSLFTFGIKQIILVGAALVVLVILLAVIVNIATSGPKTETERLSVRLTATEKVANDAQVNLKSSKLRSLNSNLKLYMTNTNRDIVSPLEKNGIDTKKISKNVITEESVSALSTRLEDARLNGVFDRTYAREMAYQLGTILTLMSELYNSSSSASLKDFLKSSYDSLKPTQESFAEFTTTD